MRFSYLFSALILIFMSCSTDSNYVGSTDSWPPNNGVRVLDSITDQPIEGAVIYIEFLANNETNSKTVITNEMGLAWWDGVVTYMRISATGYQTAIFDNGDFPKTVRLAPV